MSVPLYVTVQCEKICRQIVMAGGFATWEMFNCFSVSKTEFLVSISVIRTSPLLSTVTELHMCSVFQRGWLCVFNGICFVKISLIQLQKAFIGPVVLKKNWLIRQMNCGLVVESAGSQTCSQQVTGSNPSRRAAECNLGKLFTHVCLCRQAV